MQRIRGSTRMRYTNLLLLTYLLTYLHFQNELKETIDSVRIVVFKFGANGPDSCRFYGVKNQWRILSCI